jgi:hypothetical protein
MSILLVGQTVGQRDVAIFQEYYAGPLVNCLGIFRPTCISASYYQEQG